MVTKIVLSFLLTGLLACVLWLLFSRMLVLGMNKTAPVLFWTMLALIFLVDAWIITRIGSKQTVTILFVCLVIGTVAPYFLAAKRIDTVNTNHSRSYVDDGKQAHASCAANRSLYKSGAEVILFN